MTTKMYITVGVETEVYGFGDHTAEAIGNAVRAQVTEILKEQATSRTTKITFARVEIQEMKETGKWEFKSDE